MTQLYRSHRVYLWLVSFDIQPSNDFCHIRLILPGHVAAGKPSGRTAYWPPGKLTPAPLP